MSARGLSSRAIIGSYFARLEQAPGMEWIDAISMAMPSDQESEEYKWLGQAPGLREWIGGRNAKGFRENGITIVNKAFEATLEVLVDELRRDKTGQILIRVNEMADRTNAHWGKLLTQLLLNGATQICYDGQYFFDTDHAEGASGSQSNQISVDISGLPVAVHGSATAPSPAEMQQTILAAVQQIYGFVDDQGEPMNENASQFLVMVPTTLLNVAQSAIALPMIDNGNANIIPATDDFKLRVRATPRLNAWTDRIAVIRTDASVKPFIRQEEVPVEMSAIAEGSELEFRERKHHYGIYASRNAGYGYWQHACQAIMT